MNMLPIGTKVLILPKKAEEMSAGGLYIPDAAKDKPQEGMVVAAGPGTKDEPMIIKEGMTVMYGKYAGTELVLENETYLIMNQDDVLLCMENNDE